MLFLIAGIVLYVLAGRAIMRALRGTPREVALAGINLAGLYGFFFHGQVNGTQKYFIYLALIVLQFLALRAFADKPGGKPWIAFFVPLLALVFFHYLPVSWYAGLAHLFGLRPQGIPTLLGLSYLAFRCSRLVLEVRNGFVKMPNFWQYVNFSFFLPTMSVGPINTYANYRRGFEGPAPELPVGRAAFRCLIGCVKYEFLGSIFNQLTFSGLLLDDHPHHWIDLPVACFFYYLYLYCNFSGFCDMAIGAAGLIGIPVPENFDNPFAARNMKDFWNRWHISLSQYMRDVVFAPFSKYFVRLFGPKNLDHAIALTVLIVFLLIGIWHGVGWNFLAFGAFHALGVIGTNYYTIALKRRIGGAGLKAYNANPWIHAAAVAVTLCYSSAGFFFFANTPGEMQEILDNLR